MSYIWKKKQKKNERFSTKLDYMASWWFLSWIQIDMLTFIAFNVIICGIFNPVIVTAIEIHQF